MSEVPFHECFYRYSSACINGLISPRREVQNMLFICFKVWPMPKPPRKITCFEESSFRFWEKKEILEDENSVQSFVLNTGCCPRFRWSHVLLNHRSTAPVNRHFVKSAAPRGQRAVKSALNPGYSRVEPPLCPGGRGAGVSIDWCINTNGPP